MRLLRKFSRAFAGLFQMISSELSLKIELAGALLVLGAAYYFKITRFEFLFVLSAVFTVIIVESINTVLERMMDLIQPRYHEAAKEIKDALAAVVLFSVVAALLVGVVVFWPYL